MKDIQYIAHRINTIDELSLLDFSMGVELDLRDSVDGIYISHDPFQSGDSFEEYLKKYKCGLIILNIKSERIELKVLDLIKKYNVQDYFFLDSSFPMIKMLSDMGENNIALRYSEFEGLDTLKNMSGRVKWVWVDCFNDFPLNYNDFNYMKNELGYKICIVSPELQGREADIESYGNFMKNNDIIPDAICSKSYNKNRWQEFFEF
jgi:hypothetical protein